MTKPLKLGFVGAGFVGQVAHITNYLEIPGCEMTALAEARPQLRDLVQARYGFKNTYAHHTEMLDDDTIDAVVIVVPRPLIGPIALDCLEAGKHVITEKPMAGSLAQGQRLVDAAARSSVRYIVGYQRLHDQGIATALDAVRGFVKSGALGDIVYARAHCFGGVAYCNIDGHVMTDEVAPADMVGWPNAPEGIAGNDATGFAYTLNTYCHNVNLLRKFGGATPAVTFADLSTKNSALATFNFGGFNGLLETGAYGNQGWDEVLEIFFENGRVTVTSPPSFIRNVAATVEIYRSGENAAVTCPLMGHTWSFRRQAEAFVLACVENAPSEAEGADALEDLGLIEAMWRLHSDGHAEPSPIPIAANA
jgi:predicted dehydrogenase